MQSSNCFMDNTESKLGIQGILIRYGWKSFLKDCWIPLVGGVILGLSSLLASFDTYKLISSILSIAIGVVPIIITLILTSYTIFLSIFITNRQYAKIKQLNDIFNGITTVYAASIIISVIALGILFIMYISSMMELSSDYANVINSLSLIVIVSCITYPFVSLINIIIEMFNSGIITIKLSKFSDEDLNNLIVGSKSNRKS